MNCKTKIGIDCLLRDSYFFIETETKIQNKPPTIIKIKLKKNANKKASSVTPNSLSIFPAIIEPKNIKILPINQKATIRQLVR